MVFSQAEQIIEFQNQILKKPTMYFPSKGLEILVIWLEDLHMYGLSSMTKEFQIRVNVFTGFNYLLLG